MCYRALHHWHTSRWNTKPSDHRRRSSHVSCAHISFCVIVIQPVWKVKFSLCAKHVGIPIVQFISIRTQARIWYFLISSIGKFSWCKSRFIRCMGGPGFGDVVVQFKLPRFLLIYTISNFQNTCSFSPFLFWNRYLCIGSLFVNYLNNIQQNYRW